MGGWVEVSRLIIILKPQKLHIVALTTPNTIIPLESSDTVVTATLLWSLDSERSFNLANISTLVCQ